MISVIANWLLLSALYALIAIGFTMIFGVGNAINLFHGASITIGAYAAHYSYASGVPVAVALLIGLAVPGVVNAALYLGMIRPIQKKPIVIMVMTLILAVVVEHIVLISIGSSPRVVPALIPGTTEILGARVQINRIIVFVLSWVIIGGLMVFIKYTQLGRAITATSMDTKGAAVVGINSGRMFLSVWILAGVLAGVAGVFLASFQTATYNMGLTPLILAFAIVVIGGLGSIKGSIIGAYLIGGVETAMVSFVSPRLNGLGGMVILVLVIMFKPKGMFGRELIMEEE
ncbi:branched-chain amino acid ABC transporter permease [Saliphagus sp. GCM10025308]